jgi:hypothetical protein
VALRKFLSRVLKIQESMSRRSNIGLAMRTAGRTESSGAASGYANWAHRREVTCVSTPAPDCAHFNKAVIRTAAIGVAVLVESEEVERILPTSLTIHEGPVGISAPVARPPAVGV